MKRIPAWLAAALPLLLSPTPAWTQDNGENGPEAPAWREAAYTLPPPPNERDLVAFPVAFYPAGRFLLDTGGLAAGEDGVIRYVLVARSKSGAESVTFEGIRCATAERRFYASAGRDGQWRPFKNSAWQPLGDSGKDPRVVLAYGYFCDGPAPARSREEIIARLRNNRIDLDYLDPVRGIQP
ncbi:MAG: CNP1-like family protein [Azoarcus sp.]|jgi:hypothetical protein|nr:CNP1-like family protein [Azoarcus sp.]